MFNRYGVQGELVTFTNLNGWRLDGILYQKDTNDKTIIHVHGSFGNFYTNRWLRLMAKIYSAAGINFLCFNLLAHDGLAEAYRFQETTSKDDFDYVGFSVVDFSSFLDDIEGAVRFAKLFSKTIILQGHSLGCERVVYYLLETKNRYDFILLAPVDSYKLQSNWLINETVEDQITRLKAIEHLSNIYDWYSQEYDWLSNKEFGIRQPPDERYFIPITRKSLLSILESPVFSLFNIETTPNYWLDQRAIIFLGGNDGFRPTSADNMFLFFEEHIKSVKRLFVLESDHELTNVEEKVSHEIVTWINDDKSDIY